MDQQELSINVEQLDKAFKLVKDSGSGGFLGGQHMGFGFITVRVLGGQKAGYPERWITHVVNNKGKVIETR